MDTEADLDRAAAAIRAGGLVIYPTETVYGLGADALDPDAIGRVFEVKGRDQDDPLSLGVPNVETALEYTDPSDREERFMGRFLPGPVTVVVPKRDVVPAALTGGRDRVGVRIPDHEVALAFLEQAGRPVTATSANRSGEGSKRRVRDIATAVREATSVVLDAGETPGTESTVVDVTAGEVIRRGALADEIRDWLQAE
jgi:L-threonylcarbamoyladenylate synthase